MKYTVIVVTLLLSLPLMAFAELNSIGLIGNRASAVRQSQSIATTNLPSYESALQNLSNPAYVQTAREDGFRSDIAAVQSKARGMVQTAEQQRALAALKNIDDEITQMLPGYVMDNYGFAFATGCLVTTSGMFTTYTLRNNFFFLNLPNRLHSEGLAQYDRNPGIATYGFITGRGWQTTMDGPLAQMNCHRSMVLAVRNLRISIAYAMMRVVSQ